MRRNANVSPFQVLKTFVSGRSGSLLREFFQFLLNLDAKTVLEVIILQFLCARQ